MSCVELYMFHEQAVYTGMEYLEIIDPLPVVFEVDTHITFEHSLAHRC